MFALRCSPTGPIDLWSSGLSGILPKQENWLLILLHGIVKKNLSPFLTCRLRHEGGYNLSMRIQTTRCQWIRKLLMEFVCLKRLERMQNSFWLHSRASSGWNVRIPGVLTPDLQLSSSCMEVFYLTSVDFCFDGAIAVKLWGLLKPDGAYSNSALWAYPCLLQQKNITKSPRNSGIFSHVPTLPSNWGIWRLRHIE